MATAPRTRNEARAPLTRERVLLAAIALADAQGIEALTMRRLAQELGVEAMSLYHHVRNKQDLLGGICDLVVGEYELPARGAPWKAAVRRTAISAYDALIRHPWAASLLLSGTPESQARLRYMDALLGAFRTGGFSAGMTDHAYHALDSHIMGFTLWVVGMNLGTQEELAAMASDFLRELPRDEFPHLVEHIEQHLKPRDPDEEGEFAFGLDLLLDGLERLRDRP
jgi:AcrR family transcriptional regulator